MILNVNARWTYSPYYDQESALTLKPYQEELYCEFSSVIQSCALFMTYVLQTGLRWYNTEYTQGECDMWWKVCYSPILIRFKHTNITVKL